MAKQTRLDRYLPATRRASDDLRGLGLESDLGTVCHLLPPRSHTFVVVGNHDTKKDTPGTDNGRSMMWGEFRNVSIEESLEMLRTERVSDEQAKVLADGFGVLVQVLKALATPEGTNWQSHSLLR